MDSSLLVIFFKLNNDGPFVPVGPVGPAIPTIPVPPTVIVFVAFTGTLNRVGLPLLALICIKLRNAV